MKLAIFASLFATAAAFAPASTNNKVRYDLNKEIEYNTGEVSACNFCIWHLDIHILVHSYRHFFPL